MSGRNLFATVFLLVVGIGAAASYITGPIGTTGSGATVASLQEATGPEAEMLARLADYARATGIDEPEPKVANSDSLPDVDTMIGRLAARLEETPNDVRGWRMLGWSYFQMARYVQAASAYAKAATLDPGSAEIKTSYEEAKAKASELGLKAERP